MALLLLTSFIFPLVLIWFTSFLLKKFSKRQALSLPPGPPGIPIFGNLPFLQLELHSYFTSLAKTYGPIFSLRLGNKVAIVISTPSAAREVLKDKDIIFANRDAPIAGKVVFYGGSDILWSSYGAKWRMLRKLFTQEMYSGPMMDFICESQRKEIQRMVNKLWVKRMSPVEVREQISMTVLNSVLTILWGGGGNVMAERRPGTEFHLLMDEISVILGMPNISDFIPILSPFDLQGIKKQMKGKAQRFDKVIEMIIDERDVRDDVNVKMDFLQILLSLRKGGTDDKTHLTITQIKALIMDMLIGGTDTTSNTVEFSLAEMMNNPHIMKRAQKELEEVVDTNNMVEESHLQRLPYLHAIMKETLRLHPVGPLLTPRCSSEATNIGGYAIPKGARVFINVSAIHRDPSIWEDPMMFNPERFMRSKWNYSGNDFNYFPFGSGRRICPGVRLGEKVFMFLLASLLHSFDWKVLDGEKVNLEEKFGLAMQLKKPLVAIPVPRLSNQALYQ